LPEGIYFHGEVEDALSFIRDKSICIIPLWAGSGLKIKLVEALSASKPVITTTIGIEGVPEGVEAYCGVADENDGMAGLILDYFKRWPEPKYLAEQAAEEIRNSLSNDAVRKQLVLTLKKWELI
jgi:glycosyltransferase involved in cell wall biosynthesis